MPVAAVVGLTEVIALNVGLTDGLIGPRLFTILVLMALITTLMTGPLLSLIRRSQRKSQRPQNGWQISEPGTVSYSGYTDRCLDQPDRKDPASGRPIFMLLSG